MNLKRTLILGVSGGAIAVWIAAAATSVSQPPIDPVPHPASRAVETSGAALAAEISRLHERLRPTAEPTESRDLFSYASQQRAANARLAAASPVATAPVDIAPPPPAVKLIGIAEDGPADAVVRTAILSGLGDLFIVKEGETASRFRVVTIDGAGVELLDTSDQSILRLTLP